MSRYSKYHGRRVRVTDTLGNAITGIANASSSGCEPDEPDIRIGDCRLAALNIASIEYQPTYDEAVSTIPPGHYRHFKGGEYEVLAIARHSETEAPMVVYRALYGESGIWVRPADMWNEEIARDGRTFRRFERISS